MHRLRGFHITLSQLTIKGKKLGVLLQPTIQFSLAWLCPDCMRLRMKIIQNKGADCQYNMHTNDTIGWIAHRIEEMRDIPKKKIKLNKVLFKIRRDINIIYISYTFRWEGATYFASSTPGNQRVQQWLYIGWLFAIKLLHPLSCPQSS